MTRHEYSEQAKRGLENRFLIVDDTTWHVGASPKDAGARIFALMKMELDPSVILALLP